MPGILILSPIREAVLNATLNSLNGRPESRQAEKCAQNCATVPREEVHKAIIQVCSQRVPPPTRVVAPHKLLMPPQIEIRPVGGDSSLTVFYPGINKLSRRPQTHCGRTTEAVGGSAEEKQVTALSVATQLGKTHSPSSSLIHLVSNENENEEA